MSNNHPEYKQVPLSLDHQEVVQEDVAAFSEQPRSFFARVSRPQTSLLRHNKTVSFPNDGVSLILNRRWEGCEKTARDRNTYENLLNTVKSVEPALDQLGDYINLIQKTEEGALWVFYGKSGVGKTTFLSSLAHQVNKHQRVVETTILKANEIDFANRDIIYQFITKAINDRQFKDTPFVIVLEDRENGMTDNELQAFVQTIKTIFRQEGNTIVVLPVNDLSYGRRVVDAAIDVGVLQAKGARNTIFIYDGPKSDVYSKIVEDLTVVLNGRTLESFGIRTTDLESIPKERITIGDFIQEVAENANEQDHKVKEAIRKSQYKELILIFVFVRPIKPVDLYLGVQQIVLDHLNRINPAQVIQGASDQKTRIWKITPSKFASVINNVLHTRVVEMWPHTLHQMIQVYGPDSLNQEIAQYLVQKEINYSPTKNQARLRNAIENTNLIRILKDISPYRPNDTNLKEDDEKRPRTKTRANIIRQGMFVAEWAAKSVRAGTHVTQIHGSIALALEDIFTRSDTGSKIPGYVRTLAETTLTIPSDQGITKTVKPDITIETSDALYLLEFNFQSETRLTKPEMSNYIMRKINDYQLQLPLINKVLT